MSMSENVAAERTNSVPLEERKERIVDIYVSAESLLVYDNPWMEGDSTAAAVDNEYSGMATWLQYIIVFHSDEY